MFSGSSLQQGFVCCGCHTCNKNAVNEAAGVEGESVQIFSEILPLLLYD